MSYNSDRIARIEMSSHVELWGGRLGESETCESMCCCTRAADMAQRELPDRHLRPYPMAQLDSGNHAILEYRQPFDGIVRA